MINKLRNKLLRFSSKPLLFKLVFPVAWILLGLSRLAALMIAFRRIAPMLGVPREPETEVPPVEPFKESRARAIGAAVRSAAKYTPWESNCFSQAITVSVMLRAFRISYAVCFGVSGERTEQVLAAHAWVVCGDAIVTGGQGHRKFTPVSIFISG